MMNEQEIYLFGQIQTSQTGRLQYRGPGLTVRQIHLQTYPICKTTRQLITSTKRPKN